MRLPLGCEYSEKPVALIVAGSSKALTAYQLGRHLMPHITPTKTAQRTATLDLGMNMAYESFSPQGVAEMDQYFAALRETEPGRAALALGAGIGSFHRPCLQHGVIECLLCDRLLMNLLARHFDLVEP